MNNDLQLASDETIILVVSSHGHLRNRYTQILSALDVTVLTVSDGFEALDILRNTKITAILSDFGIPGMDGIELFLRTKELMFNVPFVICSTHINNRSKDEALKIGVMKVLKGPSNKADILNVVAEAIEERQRQILQFFL